MTNGSLMKVESIAECILQYFWPDLHLAKIGLENQFLVFLRVTVLDRFYCILTECLNWITQTERVVPGTICLLFPGNNLLLTRMDYG